MIYAEIIQSNDHKRFGAMHFLLIHGSEPDQDRMNKELEEYLEINLGEDEKYFHLLNFLAQEGFTPISETFFYKQ